VSVEYLQPEAAAQEFPGSAEPGTEELAPSPRNGARARYVPHTLTARIATGVVLLVILVVAAIGTGTALALRSFLDQRLDQQLQTTARGAGFLFRQGGAQNGPRPANVWAVVLDPTTGRVLNYPAGQNIVAMRLPTSQRAGIAARHTTDPLTVVTTDGTQLRVTVRSLFFGPVDNPAAAVPATVVIGLATEDEHSTLHRLIVLELLIGGGAVLIAIVATTYGVRFSLRRLRAVTRTAQEVVTELSPTGAGLQRRVPVADEASEVGQLAESFNTMLAAVETQFAARIESERRMRQFLADASHELRTPLTSIRGYAELARLQRAAGNGAEPDGDADNLDRIESEGTRMSRLVDDLLLLARGDDGTNSARADEPVDLAAVLEDVVQTARVAHPDRSIEIAVGEMPAVLGDRDQLLRAVRNLVTNAAVHTAPGRPILVTGGTDGHEVVVAVADGGPGLPPAEAAHVFERFWRADKARTRARGGTGLGMSIVDAIVRSHGGTVRFDSDVARGSTVTIRLPAAPVAASG
jgi:two-component system, OmpR family, sensor kinase